MPQPPAQPSAQGSSSRPSERRLALVPALPVARTAPDDEPGPAARPQDLAPVVALAPRRLARLEAETAHAAQPVRFITPELLAALDGAWGTPEDLGLARPHLYAVSR